MDERAAAALTGAGYDPTRHRARQYDAEWGAAYDLVLAMDRTHLRDLLDLGADPDRTMLFGAFDPVVVKAKVWVSPDGADLDPAIQVADQAREQPAVENHRPRRRPAEPGCRQGIRNGGSGPALPLGGCEAP